MNQRYSYFYSKNIQKKGILQKLKINLKKYALEALNKVKISL